MITSVSPNTFSSLRRRLCPSSGLSLAVGGERSAGRSDFGLALRDE